MGNRDGTKRLRIRVITSRPVGLVVIQGDPLEGTPVVVLEATPAVVELLAQAVNHLQLARAGKRGWQNFCQPFFVGDCLILGEKNLSGKRFCNMGL
jgi:hypothetical protein